jgi:hypothetical protein
VAWSHTKYARNRTGRSGLALVDQGMSGYDNEWSYANQMLREALSVTSSR